MELSNKCNDFFVKHADPPVSHLEFILQQPCVEHGQRFVRVIVHRHVQSVTFTLCHSTDHGDTRASRNKKN